MNYQSDRQTDRQTGGHDGQNNNSNSMHPIKTKTLITTVSLFITQPDHLYVVSPRGVGSKQSCVHRTLNSFNHGVFMQEVHFVFGWMNVHINILRQDA